ncbi:MAG: helix-hairpin-helix domain-containing protein [Clostridia bacterium]|nr:helix-hairpin-helix domain-containing protein [Clostridia bacterium]
MKRKKELKPGIIALCVLGVCLLTMFGGVLLRYDLTKEAAHLAAEQKKTSVSYPADEARSGRIDLNYATKEELISLPGIGEGLADRIITYRQQSAFRVPRDIKKIWGVGDQTYDKLKDLICVGEEIEVY